MATKKKPTAKKTRRPSVLKPASKPKKERKPLSPAQKNALSKGQGILQKAIAYQQGEGVKNKTVRAGGQNQTLRVYKVPLNEALKLAAKKNDLVIKTPQTRTVKTPKLKNEFVVELRTPDMIAGDLKKTMLKHDIDVEVSTYKNTMGWSTSAANVRKLGVEFVLGLADYFKEEIKKTGLKALKPEILGVNIIEPFDDFKKPKNTSFDLLGALFSCTSKNDLRPALAGVYFDSSGFAVATDAHLVLACEAPEKQVSQYSGKIIGKDKRVIDERFPDWAAVLPRTSYSSKEISMFKIGSIVATYTALKKRNLYEYRYCTLEDGSPFLNVSLLSILYSSLLKLGVEKIKINWTDPHRVVGFNAIGKGGIKIKGGIMPVDVSEFNVKSSEYLNDKSAVIIKS